MGSAAALSSIARYEILSRIGAGGMAEVYRARAPGLGRAQRLVALKRMHPHLADSPEFIELFFREAQVASTLDHPNLVAVHESGQDGGQYYLVMEYVDGVSLRQLISRVRAAGAAFDPAVAVAIAISICAGLHHAHERCDEQGRPLEIVHRDVSPGNVFVSYDGAVKLGDFGVAKATSEWTAMHSTTGTIRGKVAYMAPEQARGDAVDRRADVFAVGNVLFELLAGRRLIEGRGEVEMLHDLVFAAYPEPRIDRADCPEALAEVVRCALQRSPEHRFSTALQMQQALEAIALEHRMFAPPSAVAAFVARFAPRAPEAEPDPDAPTSVRSPAAVAPVRVDADTRTVDHVVEIDDSLPRVARARSRSWLAIPIVLAAGLAVAWTVSARDAEPKPIESTSLHLAGASLAPAAMRLRLQLSVRPASPRAEPRPAKRQRKPKRRRSAGTSTRKPPRGESLFPESG